VKCSLSTGLDLRLARSHPTLAPGTILSSETLEVRVPMQACQVVSREIHSMSLNSESMARRSMPVLRLLAPGARKPFDVIFERAKTKEWAGREDLNLRQALWLYF
jgi:hypothetical protein